MIDSVVGSATVTQALVRRLSTYSGVDQPVDLVAVQLQCPLAVLGTRAWTAWVLAVFPSDTDPLLAAAAQVRAAGLIPVREQVLPIEDLHTAGGTSATLPGLELVTAVVDLGTGESVVALLASPAPGEPQARELGDQAREVAAQVRRHLPGSTCWPVACLPDRARTLFERAARVAVSAAAARVEPGHLAAALLVDEVLGSTAPLDVPWPDPADGLLDMLLGPDGRSASEPVVRSRLAHTLAIAAPASSSGIGPTIPLPRNTPAPTGAFTAFLRSVLGGQLPGVRLVRAPDDGTAPDDLDPQAHEGGPGATDPELDPIGHATWEVSVHLGRTDTSAVHLAGTPVARDAVLGRLAELATTGVVPRLAGRLLLKVDPSLVDPVCEGQLATALTYHGTHLVVAISGPTTRSGRLLADAARDARVPLVLLSSPHRAGLLSPDPSSPPWVQIREPSDEPVPLVDLLAPIAAELAAAHRVSVADGVLAAAAAPAPPSDAEPTNPVDPFAELFDLDVPTDPPTGADPVDLGRARLDYACARAALRRDRTVCAADVPLDPSRGLPAGPAARATSPARIAAALAAQVVDQPDAVSTLSQRLAFAARGLRRTGPRAALLFAGPPGVGKTHTAGVIAESYYGNPDALIRIDCGALYDRHTINSLLGAPPAYVGYDDRRRLLTTRISSHRGRCVVLFDEVEKASPQVMDILLGVLDTGALTDLQGRTADATESIFILTSNLGSAHFTRQAAGFTPGSHHQTRSAVLAEVRAHLRPELMDRLDDLIVYRPLTRAGITELTQRHLATLTSDLAAHGYHVGVPTEVVDHLADRIDTLGVRGLRRLLETHLLRDLLGHPPGHWAARVDGATLTWHRSADGPN